MAKKKLPDGLNFYETLSAPTEVFWGDSRVWGKHKTKKIQAQASRLPEEEKVSLRRRLSTKKMRIAFIALLIGLFAGVGGLGWASVYTYNSFAPQINNQSMLLNNKNGGTTILDRSGNVLFQTDGARNVKTIPIDELPKPLIDATLAAEDPDFFAHTGFSWKATARATYKDFRNFNRGEGGSTITQQFVKNSLLTPQKSLKRKFQEVILATQLERKYTKKQILEMYLNSTYYGQGSYGVEAAAQAYFRKSAKNLNLSQSATLAGLPLGPSRFDPNVEPQSGRQRRDFVLDRMEKLGKISTEQSSSARAEKLDTSTRQITLEAPHFVFYVLDELKREYGEELVEKGGITVKTTLDKSAQAIAEEEIRNQISRLAHNHVTNGGLVSISPQTGEIIAMVGSVDYNQPDFGEVNVMLSRLQPGSSFKPFAYITAFKKGWNGATIVKDEPLSLPNGDGSTYRPRNYDGLFHGNVTLRKALGNSFNIPAIKVIQFAGLADTIQTARDLGISTLNDEGRYGVSLVLGSGEVRAIDMAGAYSAFANGGRKVDPKAILQVNNREGKDITIKKAFVGPSVLDPRLSYMITNILSDNSARLEEFGPNSPLVLSRPAAAKTGTTNDFRDNWTVGYTPQIATAVWVGNNDHSPMNNVDGITGAAPIWHNFMERAHANLPVIDFRMPAGLVGTSVCLLDGGLANPWDKAVKEFFFQESAPTNNCKSRPPAPGIAPRVYTPEVSELLQQNRRLRFL